MREIWMDPVLFGGKWSRLQRVTYLQMSSDIAKGTPKETLEDFLTWLDFGTL